MASASAPRGKLDVWGRVRSKKAAAKADSAALEADYEFARQSLAAAVARAYFSTIEAAQQEANAQETLELYEEYSKLTDERKKQGHASDFDVAQIKSRTAGARDALYRRAGGARAGHPRDRGRHQPLPGRQTRRAPLLPRPAEGRARRTARANPRAPARRRRRRAPLRRGVSSRRTKPAPRACRALRSAPPADSAARNSTASACSTRSAGASPRGVIQPIFFGGELKAAQDVRTAEQKAAAASYISVALRAFQDVEDALAGDYYLRKREGALSEMVANSADAVKLGRKQLDQGQADMFTILRLAGENLAAKIELTKVRASRLRERANLHLALGGDFKGTDYGAK